MAKTPVVTDMKVIPVAGRDSMTMTLSGAHAPFFTRNLVILTDTAGNTGVGEVHGGDYTLEALRSWKPLIVGQEIANYRKVLDRIRKAGQGKADDNGEGIQTLDISNLKFVVHADAAVECAMLDLLGQHVQLPMAALLADGQQRDKVETLGYLFYISDKAKTDLDYLDESGSTDVWFKVRRSTTLTPQAIVEQACALQEKYGFRNFKLKGGVLAGAEEMEAVRLLKKQFPAGRINIDPNGAWGLDEAIELCKGCHDILTYVEDPCGPERGYSSREIMCEFKNATGLPVATNMIATDWRQFYHAAALKAVDIVLADPHFWGLNGSLRMAQLLNDWGLTWGSHSNNHFDITLTAFAHCAAAAPGSPTALDTHWIWPDGQNLCKNTPTIKNGYLEVPQKGGMGIDLDMKKVMEAHALYNRLPYHDRDDAVSMQYLIPGWKFDPKKPCLVR